MPATVRIRYFAAARELAGCEEEEIELREGPVAELALKGMLGARHPRLEGYLGRMRLAINGDFADEGAHVGPGDEVDVLPPVAGGSDLVTLVDIRDTPLSVDEALRAVGHPSAGGICTFVGVVRDEAEGQAVARLDYEAHHELALKEMRRVLVAVAAESPGVRLAAVHRVGNLAVGDLAVVVAASAPHRAEAFAACRKAIDRIKETVPVWKKEWGPDGEATWVNLER